MPRRIIDLDEPDRFASTAVGESGERTFYLQAVQGSRVVSVTLERDQLEILAERMLAIIDELERRGLTAIDAGTATAPDEPPLAGPLCEGFHAGTLTIAWDEDVDRLIIEARSHILDEGAGESASPIIADVGEDEIPDDAPIGPDVVRVRIKPLMAQQFARQAGRLAAAGRQRCAFCGEPLDPEGHRCPRRDGSDESL
ncbi:MAG: DUF3090 family protein [Chloroflexota bacterium]